MKDKIIEILDKHAGSLPSRIADKILDLFAEERAAFDLKMLDRGDLVDTVWALAKKKFQGEPPPIEPIEWEGATISFMPAWGGYVPKVSWEDDDIYSCFKKPENIEKYYKQEDHVDYAGIDPVKWGEVELIMAGERRKLMPKPPIFERYLEDNEGIVDTEIIK